MAMVENLKDFLAKCKELSTALDSYKEEEDKLCQKIHQLSIKCIKFKEEVSKLMKMEDKDNIIIENYANY